jgi:4-hydroxy-tetrahydrodipicolinate synthase
MMRFPQFMPKLITGVWAAPETPRLSDGTLDEPAFCRGMEFLHERGIQRFAINGSPLENCLTSDEELARLLELTRISGPGKAEVICSIGAAGTHGALSKGRLAIEAGVKALLLPVPYFFEFEQEDMYAFCHEVARQLPAPILLYNLPAVSTGLDIWTVLALINDSPNIIGICDGSESLDILGALTQTGVDACRIAGHEMALAEALREQVCDGVISGIASVIPELLLTLFERGIEPDTFGFMESASLLDQVAKQIGALPAPWGLKLIGESRGIGKASFNQPLSERRAQQGRALQDWFETWWAQIS